MYLSVPHAQLNGKYASASASVGIRDYGEKGMEIRYVHVRWRYIKCMSDEPC
jgi:hypothetical protein